MKKSMIHHLDCTLRDGGYYNNWEFSHELVEKYLKTMSEININYIELGFRSIKNNNYKGPNWYTSESYLKNLQIPKNLKIGVMINTSEVLSSKVNYKIYINQIFIKQKDSKINFIRIATNFNELKMTYKIFGYLKELGYQVAVNLMQVSEITFKDLKNFFKIFNKKKPDILYLADSLGNMQKNLFPEKIKYIQTLWTGDIGIHTHDNLGLGLQNSIMSIESGAKWVDSTVTGMGRGPGNTATEYLYIELQEKGVNKNKSILPLLDLIEKYFEPLKNKYKWGKNPFYYFAGKFSIHPTYIQEMISYKLDNHEILNAINNLKNRNSRKYDSNINGVILKKNDFKNGSWSPKKYIKNKEVLLISSGNSTREYKKEIEKYILNKRPIVISLNTFSGINENLINFYISCNPIRLIANDKLLKNIKKPIILPLSFITHDYLNKFSKLKMLNYEINFKPNTYKFYDKSAIIPKLYNVSYALAVAASGKASKILLAGFDGYKFDDIRNKIVDELFYEFIQSRKGVPIISVTPTNYSLKSISIYAL
jgi:4-hydroxy 2-oxovalerate aldolase